MRIILICFGLILFLGISTAQTQQQPFSKSYLDAQIEQRGYDSDEFYDRLEDKGVFVNELDIENLTESDRLRLQRIAQETFSEMEKEAKAKKDELNKDSNLVDSLKTEKPEEDVKEEEDVKKEEEIKLSPKFGHRFFQEQIKFIEGDISKVPGNQYIIGPGDVINISTWGASVYDASYEVDAGGFIHPYIDGRNLPQLMVAGMSQTQMRNLIKDRFSRFLRFTEGQYAITVNQSREISISVYGEVNAPGTYNMSANNNAFTAIAKAGGPRENGNLREIKIIRNGQEIVVDFYDFIFSDLNLVNIGVQDQDVIYVLRSTTEVKVNGAVRDTFIFDLKRSDQMEDLIRYAGGIRGNGDPTNIQIKRYLNGKKSLVDVDFTSSAGRSASLFDGDSVFVRYVSEQTLFEYVTVDGAFYYPSQYEINSTTRVSDILSKAKLREDYTQRGAHIRRSNLDSTYTYLRFDIANVIANPNSKDNLKLLPGDELYVFSKSSFTDQKFVKISGEVRDTIVLAFDPSENMRVYDMISLAGGLTEDAYETGYVIRYDPELNEKIYFPVNVKNVERDSSNVDNIVLKAQDSIIVLNRTDFSYKFFVSIQGEVNNPGRYIYSKNISIKDLINLAGGLKINAARNRVEINRMTFRENERGQLTTAIVELDEHFNPIRGGDIKIEPFDNVIVRTIPEFTLQRYVKIEGEVVFPGPYVISKNRERVSDLIERAGGLSEEAFAEGATLFRQQDSIGLIVIELEEIMKDKKSYENIILKEGDVLTIPKLNEVVTLSGAINLNDIYLDSVNFDEERSIRVAYQPGKSVKYYIDNKGGGFKSNADEKNIVVKYADGSIGRTENRLFYRAYPKVERGSTIYVGFKSQEKEKESEKEPVDWGQLLANTISQATAVLTLILLIERSTN